MDEEPAIDAVLGQAEESVETEAELAEQADRGGVFERGEGDDAFAAEGSVRVVEHDGGGLVGVALTPVACEKGEAEIDVGERVALDESADAERHAVGLALDGEQAEAATRVHRDRAVADVGAGGVEGAHAAVADELVPRRLIEQLEDERVILSDEWPEAEAGGGVMHRRRRGRAKCAVRREPSVERWVGRLQPAGDPVHAASFSMKKTSTSSSSSITRDELVRLLNEDLSREYQAVIAYIVYSQTIKGAAYLHIAKELEKHASEELDHAIRIAKQIDYLNGTPVVVPKPVKQSDDPKEMLQFDLENERVTIKNYRERIKQAEELGEYALGEELREIITQEQEHLTDLADALGIDTPKIE